MGAKTRQPALTQQLHASATLRNIGIDIPQPRNCSPEQQQIITLLVLALYKLGHRAINYNHVRLAIPKAPIPISYRHRQFDISLLVGDRIILIDVLNISLRHWKQHQGTNHGQGQE